MEPNFTSTENETLGIVITPMHRLPIFIIALGTLFLFLPIKLWVGLGISTFGFFLLIQSFTLKLKFTPDELIVMQFGKELRRFPFENWVAWRIFFPKLPGLLYFREKVSPHLLPILFDPEMLEKELRLRVGNLEISPSTSQDNPPKK